jgi:hypothetical protein
MQMAKLQQLDTRNFKQFSYLNSFLLFEHSDILFHILQTKALDIVFCATKIKQFRSHLQNECDTEFPLLLK